MQTIVWIVVRSYFIRHRLVYRDVYTTANTVRDCMKSIRNYKYIIKNRQDPFLQNCKNVRGIYNRSGVDIRSKERLIELRIQPIRIHTF